MNQTIHSVCPGRADAATSRKSGSAGGVEKTTGRKAGTGASPPTQRLRRQRWRRSWPLRCPMRLRA
jgi:hypothetical protein